MSSSIGILSSRNTSRFSMLQSANNMLVFEIFIRNEILRCISFFPVYFSKAVEEDEGLLAILMAG